MLFVFLNEKSVAVVECFHNRRRFCDTIGQKNCIFMQEAFLYIIL